MMERRGFLSTLAGVGAVAIAAEKPLSQEENLVVLSAEEAKRIVIELPGGARYELHAIIDMIRLDEPSLADVIDIQDDYATLSPSKTRGIVTLKMSVVDSTYTRKVS